MLFYLCHASLLIIEIKNNICYWDGQHLLRDGSGHWSKGKLEPWVELPEFSLERCLLFSEKLFTFFVDSSCIILIAAVCSLFSEVNNP